MAERWIGVSYFFARLVEKLIWMFTGAIVGLIIAACVTGQRICFLNGVICFIRPDWLGL